VMAPLTPIQTGERESAPQQSRRFDVNAQGLEGSGSLCGNVVRVARRVCDEPSERHQSIAQRHAQSTGDVIVAGPRGAQPVRGGGRERRASDSRQHAEAFQDAGNLDPAQAVVSMLPLRHNLDEALGFQTRQVHARRGGTYFGHHRELGAGSRMAVEKAIKHARTSRLADGRSDPGSHAVHLSFRIHSLTVDEVLPCGKLYLPRLRTRKRRASQ